MPVPFIGRLNPTEYFALVGSFLLVGLEAIIRILTLALPTSIISLCYRASTRIFNRYTSPAEKRAELRRQPVATSIRDASDFVELCRVYGYEAEEHVLQTRDGYLLGLHRLAYKKGEEEQRVNSGPNSIKKRVVYLHHGLLMNSEVWVCLTDAQRSLPFVLLERGFDVWLGNNRGNKYSKKSVRVSPQTIDFWNFSMDEFAFYDIPDSIAYVLETTGQASLSYIGFSQGTAQAFATLAIHPKLNEQVNVFIALAPAMSPAGLSNGIVDALVKASPQVLYLLFGRRSILSSATMWESILYPPIFVKLIDLGLSFLFGWRTKNISTSQKLAAYPHLYSFTSTKSVVHWFQVIRNRCFQMYDDDVQPPLSLGSTSRYTKVAKYPTRNIKTPIVLVYGGSDSLVDIKVMLKELPSQTIATEIPHYEHLDFLWARDVDEQVFQHVFDALDSFTDAAHTKEEYARYKLARQESLSGARRGAHKRNESDVTESDVAVGTNGHDKKSHRKLDGPASFDAQTERTDSSVLPDAADQGTESPILHDAHSRNPESPAPKRSPQRNRERVSSIPSPRQPTKPRGHPHHQRHVSIDEEPTSVPSSPARKVPKRRLRTPELADTLEAAVDDASSGRRSESPVADKLKGVGVRRGSGGGSSTLSLDSMREGRGISVGASRAAGGIVTKSGAEGRATPPPAVVSAATAIGSGSGGEETQAPAPARRLKKR